MADCFVLSFRAVARASKLDWTSLECRVEGKLDRVEGRTYFTEFVVHATLRVPAGTDQERATKLMEKAEHVCLISNSLVAQRHLDPTVIVGLSPDGRRRTCHLPGVGFAAPQRAAAADRRDARGASGGHRRDRRAPARRRRTTRCGSPRRRRARCGSSLAVAERRPVLAADTTVALGDEILGKPADHADAARILGRLSGATHEVHTAVAVLHEGGADARVSTSTVDVPPR